MALLKDRVVIVCVVFNYSVFIGLKVYNIDKNSFIDVFKDELYLYDIWGLSDEAKKYLYKYKKLKDEPKFDIGVDYQTSGFRCSDAFIGYKDLPQLDIGYGVFVNTENQVISHILKEKFEKEYNLVDYRNKSTTFLLPKTLCFYRKNGMKIVNVSEDMSKIVPLGPKFYEVSSISGIDKLRSFGEDKVIPYENKRLTFKARENNKKFRRKIDVLLSDKVNKPQDVKEREVMRQLYLISSDDIAKILSNNGYQSIFKNKKPLDEIAQFIDTEKLLDEFDKLETSPCGDGDCTDLINGINQETKYLGSYSGRMQEVASLFSDRSKGIIFKKDICLSCYTMLNIYGLSSLEYNGNMLGFSPNNSHMPNSVFVDVTDRNVFSIQSLKTLIHEYMHNLSKDTVLGVSGIIKFDNSYETTYRILNEGITELLACYFLYNDLRVRNKEKVPLKYNGRYLLFDDYQKRLNPYLKSLNSVYPEVDDILSSNGKTDTRIMVSYRYNVYLVLQIMKDIGVRNVINCYFYNDVSTFDNLCRKYYSKENWNEFIDKLKDSSVSLPLDRYESSKLLLVKGDKNV